MMEDLFGTQGARQRRTEPLGDGACLLRGFAREDVPALMAAIGVLESQAPFRHLVTPGGRRMSVAMTGCGTLGWHSDARGYRYVAQDPLTGLPWPPMPPLLGGLAERAAIEAGYAGFAPQACLVNRYLPGARLSLHQDRDEDALSAPIVSVSLGLAAVFLWGGLARTDPVRHIRLESGDVVVWGGPSRLVFHGVAPLADGYHPATGRARFNLTFRRVRA
jgi:alkylated DNA repair protein (DNA oxidative demethylase)